MNIDNARIDNNDIKVWIEESIYRIIV